MANYGCDLESTINLIYNVSNQFHFNYNNNDIINELLIFNNICFYSCKNNNYDNFKKEKNREKVKEIRNKQINTVKNPTLFKCVNSKIIVLKNVFKFLGDKEKIKFILLSTRIKKLINDKIYKCILKQNKTQIKTHINIWKIKLEYQTFKNKNLYNENKANITNPQVVEKNQKIFKIIDEDLNRTDFIENKEESKKAINNILKTYQLVNNGFNYYQGMNYIVKFLYINTLDEEETFYMLISILNKKNFKELFENDLNKLKNYFIIVDHLIGLFLPKIYSQFKNNQIICDVFLTPYFMTLFTQIYSNIPEKNNLFILRLWDEFIINGWKTIFEALLCILKIKEEQILKCQGDELFEFLINKLNKDSIFLNENFDKFQKMRKLFKVPDDLIKNIEEEIELEKKSKISLNNIFEKL